MRWIWRGLAPDLAGFGAREEGCGDYDGREVRVRCEVLRPETVDELLPAADRAPGARPSPSRPGSTRSPLRRWPPCPSPRPCRSAG